MAQVTIYMDDDTADLVKSAVKKGRVSQSQWIAEAIKLRTRTEWPVPVKELAGAWPDFPELDKLRKAQAPDAAREKF